MTNLTRRFFLGGAISLIAVQTSAMPRIIGNMPQIWGDGRNDDTGGISALLRSEPVVFTKDRVTVDGHKGIRFHRGIFKISRTLEIPDDCDLTMDAPTFRAPDLDSNDPFFRVGNINGRHFASATDNAFSNVIFLCNPNHGPLVIKIGARDLEEEEIYDARRASATNFKQEENGDISYTSSAA